MSQIPDMNPLVVSEQSVTSGLSQNAKPTQSSFSVHVLFTEQLI